MNNHSMLPSARLILSIFIIPIRKQLMLMYLVAEVKLSETSVFKDI